MRSSSSCKPIDSRWVFARKTLPDGNLRYKARLVIRGFKDHHVYDYSEVYAPVIGLGDVRTLLVIANAKRWSIEQMDVDTAFLNSDLEKPVYMKIPDGVECSSEFRNTHVCKLKKALYGLKVSPKRGTCAFVMLC